MDRSGRHDPLPWGGACQTIFQKVDAVGFNHTETPTLKVPASAGIPFQYENIGRRTSGANRFGRSQPELSTADDPNFSHAPLPIRSLASNPHVDSYDPAPALSNVPPFAKPNS
jgi:hypothetical protein